MYLIEMSSKGKKSYRGGFRTVFDGIESLDIAERRISNMEFAVKLWKKPPAFRWREMNTKEVRKYEEGKARETKTDYYG